MTETTSLIPESPPQAGVGHNRPPQEESVEESLFQALRNMGVPEARARECAQFPEALQGTVNWAQNALQSAEGNPEAIPGMIVSVKDALEAGDETRKEMNTPFREQIIFVDNCFKGSTDALKGQMGEMKRILARLNQEKVDAAAKVRAEGQARLAEEARANEEAARVLAAKNAPEAEQAQLVARESRSESNNAIAAPPPRVKQVIESESGDKTTVESNVVTEVEIVDVALIPRHFMRPDITKIKAAGNRGEAVPGTSYLYGTKTTTRRSK